MQINGRVLEKAIFPELSFQELAVIFSVFLFSCAQKKINFHIKPFVVLTCSQLKVIFIEQHFSKAFWLDNFYFYFKLYKSQYPFLLSVSFIIKQAVIY